MLTKSPFDLTISETLQINAIVWVQSLPENETGPSRRVLEDLHCTTDFEVIQRSAANTAELKAVFDEITEWARSWKGLRPILHIDAHGTDKGLLLAPSGDSIPWADIINNMRRLNVATENNLICVLALCSGMHLYLETSLSQPVPAYFIIAPEHKVTAGFLEEQIPKFYQELNQSLNVTTAFDTTLKASMKSLHCQEVFFRSLLVYIRQYCKGCAKRERLERMVTKALKRNGITKPTTNQLKQTRKKFKAKLKPSQFIIDHFAPCFLIGRSAAFDYQTVQEVLDRQSQ